MAQVSGFKTFAAPQGLNAPTRCRPGAVLCEWLPDDVADGLCIGGGKDNRLFEVRKRAGTVEDGCAFRVVPADPQDGAERHQLGHLGEGKPAFIDNQRVRAPTGSFILAHHAQAEAPLSAVPDASPVDRTADRSTMRAVLDRLRDRRGGSVPTADAQSLSQI